MIGQKKTDAELREEIEAARLERRRIASEAGPSPEEAHLVLSRVLEEGRERAAVIRQQAVEGIPLVALTELALLEQACSAEQEKTLRAAIDAAPTDRAAHEKVAKLDRRIAALRKELAERERRRASRRAELEAELAQLGGDAA